MHEHLDLILLRNLTSTFIRPMLLIGLVLIFCISCEKENYYELDPEFKSYFGSYKSGSWWILKDTTANLIDSIYVTEYDEKRESDSKQSDDYYELIDYKLHCREKINWSFLNMNTEQGGLTENLSCYNNHNVNLDTEVFIDFPRIYKEDGIYKVSEDYELMIIPDYQINSFSFSDVIKVWNQADIFYFGKNVGLIQYEINNQDYILMDYFINF